MRIMMLVAVQLSDVAGRPGDELAPGTTNSILKQAGLK